MVEIEIGSDNVFKDLGYANPDIWAEMSDARAFLDKLDADLLRKIRQYTYLQIFDTFRKYYKDDKLYGGTGAIVFDDLIEIAEDLQKEWDIKDWYDCREKKDD